MHFLIQLFLFSGIREKTVREYSWRRLFADLDGFRGLNWNMKTDWERVVNRFGNVESYHVQSKSTIGEVFAWPMILPQRCNYNNIIITIQWLTLSERVCQSFHFFPPSFSGQVKLSGSICRVSAPEGKDYFIMSPRTCWSFCWCHCQMDRCQKGLGVLRCMKCGKHRENREGKGRVWAISVRFIA